MSRAVVWFRRDLRLDDNPAWAAATSEHDVVVPLFVVDPALWRSGSIRTAQLRSHLAALDAELADLGGRLKVRRGDPAEVVTDEVFRCEAVYWNDDYTPYARRRDDTVESLITSKVHRLHGVAVHRPGSLLTRGGGPYRVFTPFFGTWSGTPWEVWPQPGSGAPSSDCGEGLPDETEPVMPGGSAEAHRRLERYLEMADDYVDVRNRPDIDMTSHLSADLKFGTIAARTVAETVGVHTEGRAAFVRQLAWRDFYIHLMWHFPHSVDSAFDGRYDLMRWDDDSELLDAWTHGRTGYPIVDAGMRQLIKEGWMHNRVRMIAASFLVKDLLIDWRKGEGHFRRLLVDGDVAQNVGNWQWVAGTGADAAPFFRIFNPVTQSRKFDPNGDYIRRYVPELNELGNAHIHSPWLAGPLELQAARIVLGDTYPFPVVDHAEQREITLARYREARGD